MDLKERREFYYEVYRDELQRRDSLDASLTMPATALSFLFVGIWHHGKEFHGKAADPLEMVLLMLCGASFLIAAGLLLRAFWGSNYRYVPTVDLLEGHLQSLNHWEVEERAKASAGMTPSSADAAFEEDLVASLGRSCRHNDLQNNARGNARQKAVLFTTIGVGWLILLTISRWM